jgi:hypothetical protein
MMEGVNSTMVYYIVKMFVKVTMYPSTIIIKKLKQIN